MNHKAKKIPGIGMRIIKSAVAVALCYVVHLFRGPSGIIFHSQISALWCVQSYVSQTKNNALQRMTGTVIGAIFGLVVLLFERFLTNHFNLPQTVSYFLCGGITAAATIFVLYSTVVLKRKNSSFMSCVVFLSIVVPHLTDENPFLFAFNRFFDTTIGILIGIGVNLFHLPRKKNTDILFISGLDNTLLNSEYVLNDYCKVELNRMIDDGLNFTLATLRTPASILEPMKDIHFKLPLIAMDGAVLFDARQKKYLTKVTMTDFEKNQIIHLAHEENINCFTNIIVDDTLLIFYDKIQNDAQKKMYEQLRSSPYRNFIKQPVPENLEVVYFMFLGPNEQIENFYKRLVEEKIIVKMKVLKYSSQDYPGNTYIKIYNQHASRRNMIEYLKRLSGLDKTIFIGTNPNEYDHIVEEGNANQVVHKLKKLFEK